ncbi:MAG: RtcB family protein [Candidatus Wallbacteria bacterium]|nr:RtcB family protein [Candidatus Wallbacteria bacterium]
MQVVELKDLHLRKLSPWLWEIEQTGGMLVPGRIYTSEAMMNELRSDQCLLQVANVAHLKGIVKYALAMPDIHWGYGFPIGGVAATDPREGGVVSPGGVGYDINCGVRLASTGVMFHDVAHRLKDMVTALYQAIPCGVGSSGAVKKLGRRELDDVLVLGVEALVKKGLASEHDLLHAEEGGRLASANPDKVSDRAKERGADQLGTLGSGNHFVELQVVDQVFEPIVARRLGLDIGIMTLLIHSGSRGLGYQVCEDYLASLDHALRKYNIPVPDRQLACAPVDSPEGRDYLGAMSAAANFAWANRQTMMVLAEQALQKALGMGPRDLDLRLVYDVCHNVAKMETHDVDGQIRELCVHRKGATRCLPPGHPLVPAAYRDLGQPVLVPGDMGRYSFVCVGGEKAPDLTFGSSCHGAGRLKSRHQATRDSRGRNIAREMAERGVTVMARSYKTLAEEMPEAYKDVSQVIEVMHEAGVSKKVARLRPVGCVKG